MKYVFLLLSFLCSLFVTAQSNKLTVPLKIDDHNDLFLNGVDSVVFESIIISEKVEANSKVLDSLFKVVSIENREIAKYEKDTLKSISAFVINDASLTGSSETRYAIKEDTIVRNSSSSVFGQKFFLTDTFSISRIWATRIKSSEFVPPEIAAQVLFDQKVKNSYLRAFNKVAFGEKTSSYNPDLKVLKIDYLDTAGTPIRAESISQLQDGGLQIASKTTLKTEVTETLQYDSLRRTIKKGPFSYEYIVTSKRDVEYIVIKNERVNSYTKLIKKTTYYKE